MWYAYDIRLTIKYLLLTVQNIDCFKNTVRPRQRSTASKAKSARGDGAAQSFDSRPAWLIIKNGDCWKMAAAPGQPWIIVVITIRNNFQPVIAMLSVGVDERLLRARSDLLEEIAFSITVQFRKCQLIDITTRKCATWKKSP